MKCSLEKDRFELCEAMNRAMSDNLVNHKGKGLYVVRLMNLETFDERYVGVAYRGKAKERSMFLNLCPFCGEKLDGQHGELREGDR